MYKKFLSVALLVSMTHVLSANELEVSVVDTIENNELLASSNLDVKNESGDVIAVQQENTEVINTEDVTILRVKEEELVIQETTIEVNEPVINTEEVFQVVELATVQEEVTEASVVEAKEEIVQVTEVMEIQEPQVEVVTVQEEVIEAPVAEVIEVQEPQIEEVAPVANANQLTFDFVVTSKASEMIAGFSEEARADFNDFTVELGKNLLEMPEVQEFIAKHETIYNEYKAFKGSTPKISIDCFILGEEEINKIAAKLDENNAKFNETLSEENKAKFEEVRYNLSALLDMLLEFTVFKISTRKFPSELVNLDKDQELMINVRVD